MDDQLGKYKKRSLLVLLLLFFRGRAKYAAISLLLLFASTPFLASTETVGRLLALPPVASLLKTVGLSGFISAINPGYSAEVKAAFDKAAADSSRESLWNRFISRRNAALPPADGPSSMSMIRGNIPGPAVLRDEGPEGPVKGVVNEEEKARGEGGSEVNLEDTFSDYGDSMGSGLANSGYGRPFVNRDLESEGGAGYQGDGMYANVMSQAGEKIPVPGRPQKMGSRRMGKVSGFAWRNLGYKTRNSKAARGFKKESSPLFRLAETFSLTGAAYDSENSAHEYQASYVGATYDGNKVDAKIITTDSGSPQVQPNTSFAEDLLRGSKELSDMAKECNDAQATEGKKMSEAAKEIDKLLLESAALGEPDCCHPSRVRKWNRNHRMMMRACLDFNTNATILAKRCGGSSPGQMTCNYDRKIIDCDGFLDCILDFITQMFDALLVALAILIGIILCVVGLPVVGIPLILAGAAMLVGNYVGGDIGAAFVALGSVGAFFIGGGAAALAAGFAALVVSKGGKKPDNPDKPGKTDRSVGPGRSENTEKPK